MSEIPASESELLLEPGEEPEEGSSTESPPEETVAPVSSEEFEARVSRLCAMMANDPAMRDRLIAEIYVNIASAEMGIRGMFQMFQEQGMSGMMKGMFRRGNNG